LLRQADILLDTRDIDAASIERLSAIVIGSVALSHQPARGAVERAIEIAGQHGVPVCFDVNMRPTIWADSATARRACEPALAAATLLKFSLDDARFVLELGDAATAESVVDALRGHGNPIVVLTDGARGAWVSVRNDVAEAKLEYVPAFDIEAIEPTGAGDAFMAAVIARLLANDWQTLSRDDVRYASAAGALTTTRAGAIDSLPSRAEIESFLDARAG
jgi:sugar/nucleoside kinase (ribokinase family)